MMTAGWWMKARAEEGFLGRELGAPYEVYRSGTPMLVPLPRSFRRRHR
jgi:protein-S-isoprenylcysteine O-methyltransferase Ste14